MIKLLKPNKNQLAILKRAVKIIYPNSKITFTKDCILKIRMDDCYNINNIDVHWIEFIYRIFLPRAVKARSLWIDAKYIGNNINLYSTTVDDIFVYITQYVTALEKDIKELV